MSHEGRSALVSTALLGTPMTVGYHGWHHTARRRHVRRDFAAAGVWLGRSADPDSRLPIAGLVARQRRRAHLERFADHSRLAMVKRVLNSSAGRLGSHTTPAHRRARRLLVRQPPDAGQSRERCRRLGVVPHVRRAAARRGSVRGQLRAVPRPTHASASSGSRPQGAARGSVGLRRRRTCSAAAAGSRRSRRTT